MKSLLKMTWMEAKLFLREPVGAFFTLVFPLLMLFLFGSIYGNEPTPGSGGQGTIDVLIPALTAMIIGMTGLMSITITMATYRENGVLRRLRTTPVSPLVVMAAQVVVVFTMTGLGMLLLVTAGKLVYHVRFEGNAFSMLGGFILSSEFLRDRIHPGGHHAHGSHCPDRRNGAAVPDVDPLRGRLATRTDARNRPEVLGLPAADLRGQPAARPVDRPALGRSPAGCRCAGHDAPAGDYRLGEDIPLGVDASLSIEASIGGLS